jgi:hypothetical protein
MMKTGLKLGFMNGVVVLGSLAIVVLQWPEAMKPRGYGNYQQGQASAVFLAMLLTGIPAVLYAAFAHLALSHWLFAPDELKAYRARQTVESTPTSRTAGEGDALAPHNIKHDD